MHHIPFPRLLTGLMLLVAAGLAGCSSGHDGHKTTSGSNASESATAELGRLDPGQFASRMGGAGANVINVHIPYEGELEGTDAFIPFDKILEDSRLPADKGSEVLLYCMSGRMSEEAGAAMLAAGYTDVSHLEGGMKAWEAAGKTLIQNPEHAGG